MLNREAIKALVLSGGKGSRLSPITDRENKHSIKIAGKPILCHVIDSIISSGITDIGIIINPETGKDIQKIVVDAYNFPMKQSLKFTFITQDKPLGLAHAALTAKEFLANSPFLMYLGDNLLKFKLKNLIETYEGNTTILLKEVDDPKAFGVAEVENGKVVNLEEKPENPKSNLALVGVYLFSPEIFEAIEKIKPSPRGELEITEAIDVLIKEGKQVNSVILGKANWWLDMGKRDSLLEANRRVLKELKQATYWKFGSNLALGPVFIGKDCKLENVYLGPYTTINSNCILKNVEIENSIVQDGVTIENAGRISDSLIGKGCIIKKSEELPKTLKLMLGSNSKVEL